MNEVPWYQQLKEKRLEYGVSQNKLAVHVGISRQYISEIETGKITPTQTLQQAMFDIYVYILFLFYIAHIFS